ncbi:MAG: small multi-drug export protein [Oscillospiraceae bacterium]|nr:small multi-drug export protein [Oscillospiraceae bacterium]
MIESIKEILITFFISMLPVVELRGAVPYALAHDVAWPVALVVSIIGNMLPVPFILLFMRKMFDWLSRFRLTSRLIDFLNDHIRKKSRPVLKYATAGLIILVAIPLPGTGAWTGSMVAALLDLRMKTAVPAIFCGVAAAGAIVTFVSLSAIHVFGL